MAARLGGGGGGGGGGVGVVWCDGHVSFIQLEIQLPSHLRI
jgi:prepilin-type processing-associated H-X9-DG protein